MADGFLNFDTKINESGFNKGIDKLNGAAKSGASAVGKTLAGMGAALGAAMAVSGIAVTGLTKSFLDLAQSTREYREDQAKLDAAFITAGFTTEQAGEAYKSFYSILGEEDRSVEAVNHLAKLCSSEEELARWTDIAAGVWATFGDSLPIEGLTEAANETAKTGQLTGVLADALNWAGVSEDTFQASLDSCSSEQERAALITDTLNGLYTEASANYKKLNGDVMDAQRAQAELTDAYAQLGAIAEPVMTMLKSSAANTLQALIPFAEVLSTGLQEGLKSVSGYVQGFAQGLGGLGEALQTGGIQGFLSALGEAVPALQGVTALMGELAAKLQGMSGGELAQLTQELSGIGGAAAGLYALSQAVPVVVSAVDGINGKIGGASEAVQGFAESLIDAGGKSKTFGEAMKSMGTLSSVFLKSLSFVGGAGIIVAGLGLLYGAFGDQIDQILMLVQTKGPQIITNLANGIVSALPELIAQGSVMIQHLLEAVTANIPAIVSGGVRIVSTLVSGIAGQLPALVPVAVRMLLTFAQSLIANLPQLVNSGMQLIAGLAEGLVNSIPLLIAAIPELIQTLVSGFISNYSNFLTVGFELIATLASGIIKAVPDLLALIPEIFRAFARAIQETDWVAVGKQVMEAVIDGIKSIGSSIGSVLKTLFVGSEASAKEEGKKTGEGYAKGVESAKGSASSSAKAVAQEAANSFSTGLNSGTENAVTAASNLGNAANTGLQLSNMPLAFSADAQAAVDGVGNALNTGSFASNFAAMNLGSAANSGLQFANMAGSFSMDAQAAVNGVTNTLNLNSGNALLAGQNIGTNANTGLDLSNMGGNYSSEGTQAVTELIGAMAGGSGSVAGTAGDIGNAAGASLAGSSLTPESARLGTEAMNGLVNAINSANGTLTSAGTQAGNSILQGLKTANIAQKSRTEGQDFAKALADAIKSGSGSVRSAASSLASAAANAVNSAGLDSAGHNAGVSFSTGLANGIRAGQGGVAAAAAEVARAAVNAANANLKINSPSKVAAEIGEMFDAGIGVGLADHLGLVKTGVTGVTKAMDAGAKAALNRLQSRAASGPVLPVSSSQSGPRQSAVDYQSLLNEWEIRQRRLNQQRDDRPIILNGRNLNRAAKTPGGKIGGAVAVS